MNLTNGFLTFALVCFYSVLSNQQIDKQTLSLYIILTFFFSVLLFPVKFTSSLSLFVALILSFTFAQKKVSTLRFFLCGTVGTLVGIFVFHFFIQNIGVYLKQFFVGFDAVTKENHSFFNLIISYSKNTFVVLLQQGVFFFPLLFTGTNNYRIRAKNRFFLVIYWVFTIGYWFWAGLKFGLFSTIGGNEYLIYTANKSILTPLVYCSIVLVKTYFYGELNKISRNDWVGILLSIAIPFVGSMGTNISLFGMIICFVQFWGIGLILIWNNFEKLFDLRFQKICISLIMLSIFFKIYPSNQNPYRNHGEFKDYTFTSNLSAFKGIQLDYETKQAYESINAVIQPHKKNSNNILIAYLLPGVNLITETVSPTVAWFEHGNCSLFISMTDFSTLPIFTALKKEPLSSKMKTTLASKGIDFEADYQKLKTSIWLPYQKDSLQIFIPKHR
jgi:hypothetical protein